MSAAAVPRPAPAGTALADLKPGEYLTCGSIDPAGTALRIDRLRKEVLSRYSKLIAWAVYRHLDDVQRSGVGDEFDQTFKGTAADAKWARLFFARIQQRLEDEDSRWMFLRYDVRHNADDTIQITYEVMERADTINGVHKWIVGMIDASNAAEVEICDLGGYLGTPTNA